MADTCTEALLIVRPILKESSSSLQGTVPDVHLHDAK